MTTTLPEQVQPLASRIYLELGLVLELGLKPGFGLKAELGLVADLGFDPWMTSVINLEDKSRR